MYNPYADAPLIATVLRLAGPRQATQAPDRFAENGRDGETAIYLAALHRLLAEKSENA